MSVKLCWLTLVAGCSCTLHGASGAYLPELGPSPLRFRLRPALVATVAMLPPLRMTDAPPMTNDMASVAATNELLTVVSEPLGPVWPGPAGTNDVPATTTSGAPGVPTQQPSVVTPQMLADFFRNAGGATNPPPPSATGTFTPPPAPASSATYKSN